MVVENLRRWQESGQPRSWVEARQGRWNHVDWLSLSESLEQSEYWPLQLPAVGELLEEQRTHYDNFQRWKPTDQARRWVAERQGEWDHGGWLAFLDGLRTS